MEHHKQDDVKKHIEKLVKPIFEKVISESSKGNRISGDVNKSSVGKDVYFSIINAIRNGIYPSRLASKLNVKRQALTRYIRRLKIDGIIIKKGYGTWEINEQKYNEFLQSKDVNKSSAVAIKDCKSMFTSGKRIRGHGFQITVRIPRIRGWEKRREYLEREKIKNPSLSYELIGSNWDGERIIVQGHKVWLTPISIIIYAPEWKSWFAKISKDSQSHAIYDLLQIIKKTETLLKVSFEKNKKYEWKVSRQHYGIIKNALAVQYDKTGKKMYCYAERGLIYVIDNSHNLHEFEGMHPDTAVQDTQIVDNFFVSLSQHPITPEQILNTFQIIAQNQKTEQEKWSFYAENIGSHTKAIIKLEKGIGRLIDLKQGKPTPKPKKQRISPNILRHLNKKGELVY